MFLVYFTFGSDPYDHTKINDYFLKAEIRLDLAMAWHARWLAQAKLLQKDNKVCWYNLNLVSLKEQKSILSDYYWVPQKERIVFNTKKGETPAPVPAGTELAALADMIQTWGIPSSTPQLPSVTVEQLLINDL